MKSLTSSDQFQINEILRKLGESDLKAYQTESLEGLILKISKEVGAFQIWFFIMPGIKDVKPEVLDQIALMNESIQTVFIGKIPNETNESNEFYRRKSRKPGPDLKPH